MEWGIHARPAGRLARLASGFDCAISVGRAGNMVDAKNIFGVLSLSLKQGDLLTATFDGSDEESAAAAIMEYLRQNV